MRFRLSNSRDPARYRLPLIALIDVVLFLLLYFMVAGTLAPEEAELSAALRSERGASSKALDLQPQVISVLPGADGHAEFRLGGRVARDKASLAAVLEQLPKEGGVFVKTSGRVHVEAAATALQACKDAGFVRITYVPAK